MHTARAADPLVTAAPPFDRLISEHMPMIRRIAAAHESNASAREDLIQEILCAVWRALPSFRSEGGVRGFIARIAANRAITHVQRAVRSGHSTALPSDLADSEPSPEAHAIASDQSTRLMVALRSLPIGLREPALLALEGFSPQEIASVLGITSNAVAVRMTRARSELRAILTGE